MSKADEIYVQQIEHEKELQKAFEIREKVYIVEQHIDREDEFDEFDPIAKHFLAVCNDTACGTARYRQTEEGIKLERFAVLPEFRHRGIASRIMETMLDQIKVDAEVNEKIYLYAQASAMPLYEKFKFNPEGDRFMECGIEHQKMIRYLR